MWIDWHWKQQARKTISTQYVVMDVWHAVRAIFRRFLSRSLGMSSIRVIMNCSDMIRGLEKDDVMIDSETHELI